MEGTAMQILSMRPAEKKEHDVVKPNQKFLEESTTSICSDFSLEDYEELDVPTSSSSSSRIAARRVSCRTGAIKVSDVTKRFVKQLDENCEELGVTPTSSTPRARRSSCRTGAMKVSDLTKQFVRQQPADGLKSGQVYAIQKSSEGNFVKTSISSLFSIDASEELTVPTSSSSTAVTRRVSCRTGAFKVSDLTRNFVQKLDDGEQLTAPKSSITRRTSCREGAVKVSDLTKQFVKDQCADGFTDCVKLGQANSNKERKWKNFKKVTAKPQTPESSIIHSAKSDPIETVSDQEEQTISEQEEQTISEQEEQTIDEHEELTISEKEEQTIDADEEQNIDEGESNIDEEEEQTIVKQEEQAINEEQTISEHEEDFTQLPLVFSTGKFSYKYSIARELGDGAFSVVHEAIDEETNAVYAVKIIDQEENDEEFYFDAEDEIRMLVHLKHPNILSLTDLYREGSIYYLVSEIMLGGELLDRLVDKEFYNEDDARCVAISVLDALNYCHERRIAHRDMKPENLLLKSKDNDWDLVIADFGMAKKVLKPDSLTTKCGTPGYVAPEILDLTYSKRNLGFGYDVECDMWSFGVILYVLLGGYAPFEDDNPRELSRKICEADFQFHDQFWKDVSQDAKNLISSFLNVNPNHRMTAANALETNEWLNSSKERLGKLDRKDSLDQLKRFMIKKKLKAAAHMIQACHRLNSLALRDDTELSSSSDDESCA